MFEELFDGSFLEGGYTADLSSADLSFLNEIMGKDDDNPAIDDDDIAPLPIPVHRQCGERDAAAVEFRVPSTLQPTPSRAQRLLIMPSSDSDSESEKDIKTPPRVVRQKGTMNLAAISTRPTPSSSPTPPSSPSCDGHSDAGSDGHSDAGSDANSDASNVVAQEGDLTIINALMAEEIINGDAAVLDATAMAVACDPAPDADADADATPGWEDGPNLSPANDDFFEIVDGLLSQMLEEECAAGEGMPVPHDFPLNPPVRKLPDFDVNQRVPLAQVQLLGQRLNVLVG